MPYSLLTYSSSKEIKTVAPLTEFTVLFHKKMDKLLEKAYINFVQKNDYELTFKGIIFRFIWNGFNRFNGITKGVIKIEEKKGILFYNFKLHFTEVFFLCLMFSIIPFLGVFDSIVFRILALVIIWAIYIGNNVLAVNRFKALLDIIQNEVNEIPEYKKEIAYRKEIKNAPAKSR